MDDGLTRDRIQTSGQRLDPKKKTDKFCRGTTRHLSKFYTITKWPILRQVRVRKENRFDMNFDIAIESVFFARVDNEKNETAFLLKSITLIYSL